jgi:WD40 repeat protein
VRIWDAGSGQMIYQLPGHLELATSVAWSPDGLLLASGGWDNVARIWEAATGENVATLSGHTLAVVGVAWSPDGTRLTSSSEDGTVRVWGVTAVSP